MGFRIRRLFVLDLGSRSRGAGQDPFDQPLGRFIGRRFLAEQIRLTRRRMRFYHRNSLHQPARLKASWSEHARVIDAIRGGDDTLAQTAMREHILYGGRVYADMIANLGNSENGKS